MIEVGVDPLNTCRCTTCFKEIGTNTGNVLLVGGWPFCRMKCIEEVKARIAWNRKNYNYNILHYWDAKLHDFQCTTKGPQMRPVDSEEEQQ